MSLAPWLETAWHQWHERSVRGRRPHALAIVGPAGLGKRSLAQAIVASTLCRTPGSDGHACGSCRGCTLRVAGSHPDFVTVSFGLRDDGTPKTEIAVDQIRALCAGLAQTAQLGGARVAVIDPADAMNAAAANALLKTLEEPGEDTLIVLVADAPSRLPATIRSRCQRIEARFPPRAVAQSWLESEGLSSEDARAALEAAAGNPGLARELVEPAARALGRDVGAQLTALATGRASLAGTASQWAKDRPDLRLLWAAQLARLLVWAHAGRALAPEWSELARLTAPAGAHKLAAWFDRANRTRELLRTPLRDDLVLIELLTEWRTMARA